MNVKAWPMIQMQCVHVYCISYDMIYIGVEMSLPYETYVFHFTNSSVSPNISTVCRLLLLLLLLLMLVRKSVLMPPLKYANAFQMDICVRIIIFNGCRVSRLTVLLCLVWNRSAKTLYIVFCITCRIVRQFTWSWNKILWFALCALCVCTTMHTKSVRFVKNDEWTLLFDFYTYIWISHPWTTFNLQIERPRSSTVCTSYNDKCMIQFSALSA